MASNVRSGHRLGRLLSTLGLLGLSAAAPVQGAAERPTIVLVHGAFADASSWNGVIDRLVADGYEVHAVANPLRGVAHDASYVKAVLRTLKGPIVLVGHSYGGAVISSAGDAPNVQSLVFVAAFLPEAGETSLALSSKFPGSTLGGALQEPVLLPDGGRDLYIRLDRFRAQFAADVPASKAQEMAATQRPIAEAALTEPAPPPAWRSRPVWTLYGTGDRNIPAAVQAFMAKRASARRTIEIPGASHVVMVSHPDEVAELIKEAAARPTSAR